MDIDVEDATAATLDLPEIGSSPVPTRIMNPAIPNLAGVRGNLQTYGRGLYKPPFSPPAVRRPTVTPSALPALPAKLTVDLLLEDYHASIHNVLPILDWAAFQYQKDAIYNARTFQDVPLAWIAVFFSVLACGVLHTISPALRRVEEGQSFLETARSLTVLWEEDYTVDHVRASLLTSIALWEMSLPSAAWTWLGSSIYISQDIGLHREIKPVTNTEHDAQKRVWWCVYIWDR